MQESVSLAPGDQVEGGSFFNDVDVRIVKAEAKKTDFVNKDGVVVVSDVTVLAVTFHPLTMESAEHDFIENLSAGSSLIPNADGDGFVPRDDSKESKGLQENSKAGMFLAELEKAGFPKTSWTKSLRCIEGVEGHLLRKEPPKKSGTKGDSKPMPFIVKVTALAGKGSGASSGGTSPAAEKLAKTIITKLLEKNPDKAITKVQLSGAANKALAGKPEQKAVVELLLSDTFLKTQDGWSFDGRAVSVPTAVEVSL